MSHPWPQQASAADAAYAALLRATLDASSGGSVAEDREALKSEGGVARRLKKECRAGSGLSPAPSEWLRPRPRRGPGHPSQVRSCRPFPPHPSGLAPRHRLALQFRAAQKARLNAELSSAGTLKKVML